MTLFADSAGFGRPEQTNIVLKLAHGVASLFGAIGAAARIAAAVENHRKPAASDLALLGVTAPLPWCP